MSRSSLIRGCVIILLVLAGGCTIHPSGEREERDAAMHSGKPFEKRIEARRTPPLPQNPTPDQLVEYAQLTSAELEQRYWQWRSAIEQIPQDGTQPTTLNLAAGTAITNGKTSWGGSTLALSNDPMNNIKWPGKMDAAARQALENARAAGRRFFKAKFDLRGKVLGAYYDYALNAQLIRLEQRNLRLLETAATDTKARNRAGSAGQQDVLKAQNEAEMSGNEIAAMESQLPAQLAAINALLNRPADAPLPVPAELPPARAIAYSDGELVELAAKQNPELIALADEIRARADAIRLAKLQYVPDFNLSAGTDLAGVTQSLLGQATIPVFRYEALNAAIAQARANLRASEAQRRQAGNDLAAQVAADIATIRDADRQIDLLRDTILPLRQQHRLAGPRVLPNRQRLPSGLAGRSAIPDRHRAAIGEPANHAVQAPGGNRSDRCHGFVVLKAATGVRSIEISFRPWGEKGGHKPFIMAYDPLFPFFSHMKNTFVLKLILQITVYMLVLAGLFFVPAGTLAWPRAWVYLGLMYVIMVAAVIHLDRADHELLVERSKWRGQKGQPLSDKIVMSAFLAAYYPLMVFIPLDVFRFHLLARPPMIVSSLGLVIYLVGWGIVYLALRTNPFAAPLVKLQAERGHRVIDVGVYGIVPHPMYAGAIFVLVGLPLWLESYAAALLECVPLGLLAVRCLLEEKFLRRNLSGYADYMRRVRYRMIPHLW